MLLSHVLNAYRRKPWNEWWANEYTAYLMRLWCPAEPPTTVTLSADEARKLDAEIDGILTDLWADQPLWD